MDNLIEFAKKQCEIFPEDSDMGMYLRETLKMLQEKSCENAAEVYKNSRLPFDIMMYQILVCADIANKEKAFDKIMDKFKEVENIENQA